MTRIRARTIVLLILIVGAFATACDDDGDATSDAPEPATTTVEPAATDREPAGLSLIHI